MKYPTHFTSGSLNEVMTIKKEILSSLKRSAAFLEVKLFLFDQFFSRMSY